MAKAIKQMVDFIKQEAKEKCEEIMIKAEEEFNQVFIIYLILLSYAHNTNSLAHTENTYINIQSI
jgi:hypothetical protein